MEIGLFIKKFITFFVEPIGIVMVLFIVGIFYFYKNNHKIAERFLLSSFMFLFLFSYAPISNFLVENLEDKYTKYEHSQSVRYIHVLGNGHIVDGDQPLSSQLDTSGVRRVLEGVIIHKSMPNSKIIFTGYAGRTDVTNAVMNSRLASALGVAKKEMIVNGYPVDTREEAIFTKTIVGSEPFILVTSASHMPRAMSLFESLGMKPIAAPTDFQKSKLDTLLYAPSIEAFKTSEVAIHEYIGILYSQIKNILH